jgi:hypothetical protein
MDKARYYVLVCEANDTALVTREYIVTPEQAISSEDRKILDQYHLKMTLVNRDENLNPEQKRLKKVSIYPLVFTDTVTYQLNDIECIGFDREERSRLSEYGSLGLFCISSILWASGIVNLGNADLPTGKKQSIGLLSVAGIIGSTAAIKWMLTTKQKNISPEKWILRME